MSALAEANRVLESCGSTNDLARAMGEAGAPHGTWVSARGQVGGRGRLGRRWESEEGNLFLSLVARIEDKALWTWVPLATAVGVARALTARFALLEPRIKWPNDLWVGGAKLGGILCEAVGNRQGSFIVIGLGLNCLHAPEGLDQATVSLTDALGQRVDADAVRATVISGILATLDELASRGTEGVARDFGRWAAFPEGSGIEWHAGSEICSGVVRGLGSVGELLVESGGRLQRLYAEDVRLRKGALTPPKASGGSPA